jgi:hypothetical protein
MIFTYQLIVYSDYKTREAFKAAIDDKEIYKTNTQPDLNKKIQTFHNIFPNKQTIEEDQSLEFLTVNDQYNIKSDSKFMINLDKLVKVNPIEFENFRKRIDIYKKLRDEWRFSKKVLDLKKKLINNEIKINKINYPIIRVELSLLQMDSVVSYVLLKYNFSEKILKQKTRINNLNLEEDDYTQIKTDYIKNKRDVFKNKYHKFESYKFIKNWLLEVLSQQADDEHYRLKFVQSTRFKFKFDKVLNYFIDYNNSLERFIFNGVLHRDNKEHNYFIYFDIIFDFKNINYYVNDIIILGINIEEYVLFADLLNKDYNYDSKGVHLSLSKENPAYVSDNYINDYRDTVDKFVKENEIKYNKKKMEHTGYCFFKDAKDKNNCISYTAEDGVGIWDTQCNYDEECPFFKKNSNYPNRRGGCINGFCEMPVNVNLLGYKEFDEGKLDKAICHNCKHTPGCNGIECSQCCEEQKDSDLYPELKSPDYAFPKDFNERLKHADYFEKKNMAPNYLII